MKNGYKNSRSLKGRATIAVHLCTFGSRYHQYEQSYFVRDKGFLN
ncbi:hypothetical protein XBKQ1_400007 [Xenorhabdus bovienii str. kraussei Quebec]|uniref:Uncharacterized protein n=1 Tax=Xenorhabdus bovienii str. kraussei Quebec TaxID=1398203 RepID=A0A077PK32_XENBV|nr:hypothetical protein XBKQ1_400007 [Xenorhabdus bovienii str. kraussei Quebec]